MGKGADQLNLFAITLTNPQAVYYAGQVLEGCVTVELNDAMKMRGISLEFEGRACVHWTEQHKTGSGKQRRTEIRHYSANENYFKFEVLLFGLGTGTTYLQAGCHTFPFVYTLPPNLPSSFESYTGNVRYQIKCNIEKTKKTEHYTKKMFTVVSILDLNQQPSAMDSVQGQDSKNLCCLCCKSGPISAIFRVDRAGYVPGDTVYLSAEITNLSTRKMNSSKVKLIMATSYHATTKSKTIDKEVACVEHGTIEPGESDIWSGDQLFIPPLPPSYLVGCNIIDIKYMIVLVVDPSGPAYFLEVPLEIVIGTIPLRQVVQQYYPKFQPSPGPIQPTTPVSMPSDLPPPSYSECVFGKVDVADEEDNEHTMCDKDFAPAYTYYDWSKHPATT